MIISYPPTILSRSREYIKSIRNETILAVILFLGLFLRIYNLSYESIWLDEAFSIRLAKFGFLDIVKGSINDTHPPLYHLVLHHWVRLTGSSEFATRLLSVMFGFFTIFMFYKLASLIFNKEVGILSVLILALSVFHIHYSQEARMYSLLSLLTLVSMYFFIRYIKERDFLISAGYVISSVLLIYTHIYGLFIIIAQNLFFITLLFFSHKEDKLYFKNWVLLQLILTVLFSPWIIVLINQMMRIRGTFWIPVPSARTIIDYLKIYSGSNQFYIFISLSIFSIVNYRKIKFDIKWENLFKSIEDSQWNIRLANVVWIYLLLVWLFIPNILPFIISKISTPIYWDRYTIEASFGFYLLAAAGIRNIKYTYLKLFIISIIIVFSSMNIWTYYKEINKEQWRDVANYIDVNAENSDLILFNAGFNKMPFDFYSRRSDLIKKSFPEKTRDVDEENIKKLSSVIEGYSRIWVILSKSHDYKNMIKRKLSNSYRLLFNKEYIIESYYASNDRIGIEVCLFEKN